MSLPNPGMDAVPFTPLTSEFLDNLIENIEALSAGTGITVGGVGADRIAPTAAFVEIGRTTLSSASDTITVSSLPARRYLKIVCNVLATGGTVGGSIRFNNDSGSNYSERYVATGATPFTTLINQTSALFRGGTGAFSQFVVGYFFNIATLEKSGHYEGSMPGAAGAGNVPNGLNGVIKWANTSNQITRIDLINNGTGDFAIGSQVVVYGCD